MYKKFKGTLKKNDIASIKKTKKMENIKKKIIFSKNLFKNMLKSKYFINIRRKYKKINKKFKLKVYPREEIYNNIINNFDNINEMFFRFIGLKMNHLIDIVFSNSLTIKKVKISTVTRQTRSGRQFRKKVCIVIGDFRGHVGLGIKSSLNYYEALNSAIKRAKLNFTRIKRGFWEDTSGRPHTLASRCSGKFGSVIINIIPAPRGKGIKAARYQYDVISVSGVHDCYTKSFGSTKSSFNTIQATYKALLLSYSFNSPDIWRITTNKNFSDLI
uniref:Small ribosomal subunit protein uS5 n=2 Tax=Amorphochlora amoebiformis TaxID=1561963 RepID=A0A0H5BHT6_9EUKA|nr:ribosomal protein S2 [Amorphochlora amoebiformis]